MATGPDSTATRPRSRRSLAHVPRSKMTSGLDKENATTDIGAIESSAQNTRTTTRDKKSRSKSLGPGGLDALQHSNGNRRKSTASFPLKSILKPTIPVSPVRNIPSFEETRRRTPSREASTQKADAASNDQKREGLLIDFGTPNQPAVRGGGNADNPFDNFNATSAIRDEMAATKERDEKERRDRERQTILEKREARRKSMANRRVSFAPEATLHTWNVIEIPDDATSSSASNSTRRASSLTSQQDQQNAPNAPNDTPSSPDEAESDLGFSPVREQDLQQISNRSVSDGTDDSHAALSSSPFSGGSAASEDTGVHSVVGEDEEIEFSGSEDEFDAESTAMSMDDLTARSSATVQSDASSSSSSSARLNNALRQAAREAGTQAIDDTGEISMEIADQEITGAFQPWIKKGQRQSFDWDDLSARHDQENVDLAKDSSVQDLPASDDMDLDDEVDEELSMDVTNVVGGILSKVSGRRQSAASRKSMGQETNYGDQTMEITSVVGGIAGTGSPSKAFDESNGDEEMTMEFTSVVGGVLSKGPAQHTVLDSTDQSATDNPNFDRVSTDADGDSDEGMEMEMTGAVGGILPSGLETSDKAQAKRIMELEAESGQLGSSPFRENAQQSPAKSSAKSPLAMQLAIVASEEGSPSRASVQPRRQSRRSSVLGQSRTPVLGVGQQPPTERPSTPSQMLTPQPRPTTPSKTPPSANVTFRSASPKKLFKPEIRQSAEKQKPSRPSIFEQDLSTGHSTPRIVLQPREGRRSSGLGIDKEGLGSPRVAALLDKRVSLGANTPQFVPQQRPHAGGVRFEDPLKMQEEEQREREEEELREDGHLPPANTQSRDPTASLKDLISRMSPKKGKVGNRKSLHVGAARGILGKRPAELDLDEEEMENSPKRLRGHTVSPVKGVRLPAPSHDIASGRSIRSPVRRARSSSPLKGSTTPTQEVTGDSNNGTTPLNKGIDALQLASDSHQPQEEEVDAITEEQDEDVEPIQLQDFLNMTNIHFMELTTTKRRHTTAPGSATKRLSRASSGNIAKQSVITFDDCVAAGFCTVPMLELYQHSCRELKSYISEGRQVIRSIEAETYADNPPLFREYVTAPPDIRVIMDNQFRNVKTHARLLSKATWYEWRMKLLEGLKEGLHRHVADMKADDSLLSQREELLNSVLPPLLEKHASLQQEATNLQQLVEEMENCDQEELQGARQKLSTVEDELEARKRELAQLQVEAQEKSNIIEAGSQMRDDYLAQIQEAERVKEECRGWSARDIRELKASVQKIEDKTGWSITSASTSAESATGPKLIMTYRSQLQIEFYPEAFATTSSGADKTNLPLKLRPVEGKSISLIASLVLQSLQRHLAAIQQSTITRKQLLRFVSSAWDRTTGLENEAHMLEFCGLTRLTLGDSDPASLSLRARCTLLGNATVSSTPGPKGAAAKNNSTKRIDVDFTVRPRIDIEAEDMKPIGCLEFDIEVIATKVYGFGADNKSGLSGQEMQSILGKGMSRDNGKTLGNGVWCRAVQMLTGSAF